VSAELEPLHMHDRAIRISDDLPPGAPIIAALRRATAG